MAIHEILKMGDARLLRVAQPVESFDTGALHLLVRDMFETMRDVEGVGLAAPQIGVGLQIFVYEIGEDSGVFINPTIELGDETQEGGEGCLSVPGYYDKVARAERVTVRAQDAHGKPFELAADGLLAVCIQHEMDHLVGKVFVDYLSPLKRARVTTRMKKKQKLAG